VQEQERPLGLVWLVLGGGAIAAALLALGLNSPEMLGKVTPSGGPVTIPLLGSLGTAPSQTTPAEPLPTRALGELLKLVVAAMAGMIVTAVHRRCKREKPLPPGMVQAQVLLTVAGALTMVIIGESLARAFGIAGAAAIIRFRTPVKDPKDAVVLFLLMAVGMSAGLGALSVTLMGTVFLCVILVALDWATRERTKSRDLVLELIAAGDQFPTAHVQGIFTSQKIRFETREVTHGKETAVKYFVSLDPALSLEQLSNTLMHDGAIKAVAWEKAKKKWTI
jgi:uncharacterized membrane protein YhiD involved in acid resistance